MSLGALKAGSLLEYAVNLLKKVDDNFWNSFAANLAAGLIISLLTALVAWLALRKKVFLTAENLKDKAEKESQDFLSMLMGVSSSTLYERQSSYQFKSLSGDVYISSIEGIHRASEVKRGILLPAGKEVVLDESMTPQFFP